MDNNNEFYRFLIDRTMIAEQAESYLGLRKLSPNECCEILEYLFNDGELIDLINEKILEIVEENDTIAERNKNAEKTIPRYEVFGCAKNMDKPQRLAIFNNEDDAMNHIYNDFINKFDDWKIFIVDTDGSKKEIYDHNSAMSIGSNKNDQNLPAGQNVVN